MTSVSSIPHGSEPASAWIRRWAHLIPAGGTVLDVACGHGRHMQWLAAQGHRVTGIDRSPEALAAAGRWGRVLEADIENGPWPLLADGTPQRFDAVVVTNYLWRPLLPVIAASVVPGGVLLYETFAAGNETVGKPSRPDFLLRPGELLQAFTDLRPVAYEDGFIETPTRFVQRLVAVREAASATPPRYRLG